MTISRSSGVRPSTVRPALQSRSSRRRRISIPKIVATIAITLVAAFWFSPFVILLFTSVRSASDFLQNGPLVAPNSFTLANFGIAWEQGLFSSTYVNSALITIVKVPVGVAISALLAFALAKLQMRFRRAVMFFVFLGLTLPIYIAVVPIFGIVRSIGLIDNLWGLLLPYLAFGIPFTTLVLQSFFRSVPDGIIEAARIDGASNLRIFVQVVLPLSIPVLVTVSILDVVATWNEFLLALVILNSDENKTLPLGLLNFSGQFGTNYTALAAGILIAVLPMLIAYALLQRYIVSGLTAGAVKG